jgi:hypothetical protein
MGSAIWLEMRPSKEIWPVMCVGGIIGWQSSKLVRKCLGKWPDICYILEHHPTRESRENSSYIEGVISTVAGLMIFNNYNNPAVVDKDIS